MDISKIEKMNLLLKQLQIPEEYIENYFQESYLEKLEVYKRTKTWHFHVHIKKILPFDIYRLFTVHLEENFQKMAKVELSIQAEENECDEGAITSYWSHFVQTLRNLSPAYKDLIYNQVPEVNNKKIMLTARNEAEAAADRKSVV